MWQYIKESWMRFAKLLAAVNNAVLLAALFFCIITPLGLIMRLFRKSPLASSAQTSSYWAPLPSDGDLKRPF